jgi:hypothetical protein
MVGIRVSRGLPHVPVDTDDHAPCFDPAKCRRQHGPIVSSLAFLAVTVAYPAARWPRGRSTVISAGIDIAISSGVMGAEVKAGGSLDVIERACINASAISLWRSTATLRRLPTEDAHPLPVASCTRVCIGPDASDVGGIDGNGCRWRPRSGVEARGG